MKNLLKTINESIIKGRRILFITIFILAAIYTTKSVYDLFNPASDVGYENKIREEIQAKEVKFDSKIIKKIVDQNLQGSTVPLVNVGKNPFLVY